VRILVLGGTQFIGRHIVAALLDADHAVTVFNRGTSADALPAAVERRRGDRDLGAAGLESLRAGRWDACIDVSGYTPRQVGASVALLQSQVDRYVYISAVSVYGDPQSRPVTEAYARIEPAAHDVIEVNGETYGALKVACEDLVLAAFATRAVVLRPQIVAGPFDPSGRIEDWIHRARHSMPMLAPGDGSDHLQVIDVRDVAAFIVRLMAQGTTGTFNLAGERRRWDEFIGMLAPRSVCWVPAGLLRQAKLTFLELALFREEHGPRSALMAVDNRRALDAGLAVRPLQQTLADTASWLAQRGTAPALLPEREAALIARAKCRPQSSPQSR
jgi:2'-hydroxyisoflavone reductase